MKKILLLIIALVANVNVWAEDMPTTLAGWADRLKRFGTSVPQEELFVHMDNSCYFLGDTIYYKAYLRRSDNDHPSALSGLLYVELLDQDGYLVQRQKVQMTNGQGHGSFVLLDSLYSGYYELRAYTRWQLNWGVYQHPHTKAAEKWFYNTRMAKQFYRDYDKLYSRVFPVYNKPQVPGEYYQEMTTRPLRRYSKASTFSTSTQLSLFPEGGCLVAGTTCHVAFEADDNEGKHLKGKLQVTNSAGQVVATSEVVSRGRGTFDLPCQAGEKYKATFTPESGSAKTVSLPQVETDGVAMHATVSDAGIHIDLQSQGTASTEELGLTAMINGVERDFQSLGTGSKASVDIPLGKLTTGVVQLTIFNAQGRIYADRLVFVREPNFKAQNVTFSGISDQGYKAFEPIDIQVQGEAQGTISVAVRDAAHSDYTFDSGNILTEMLLSSQIKGFVEQPEYFFESNDEEHTRALDLLLMVQGWRRFNWVQMATPGEFQLNNTYERTEMLIGEVNKYTAERPEDPFSEIAQADAEKYMEDAQGIDDIPEEISEGDNTDIGGKQMYQDMLDEMKAWNRNDKDGTRMSGDYETSASRFYANEGSLKHEVTVHAEFVQTYDDKSVDAVEGDMTTYNKGMFKIEAPKFVDRLYLNLGAADSSKLKSAKPYIWVQSNENGSYEMEYPDYYVKLNPIYPRFVKAYSYYQNNLFDVKRTAQKRLTRVEDANVTTLNEVTIGAKRNGTRSFDASKPAFVIDAYQAFNDVCDAGFCPAYFIGGNRFTWDLARTYIGDMNMERQYDVERRYNSKNLSSNLSDGDKEKYNHLPNLDKVYIYTDYSPRLEGNKKFNNDNQPMVTIDLRRYEDESQRQTYRDRHYVLSGYAVCEDFYQPDYNRKPLASTPDYRRTLYWNPDLQLDAQGKAQIHLFNNNSQSQVTVSAEGMTPQGQPLTGISYPEDR